jgi:hypothetical protein
MAVFDFLKVAKKGSPATQIAELDASLARLRAEHKSVQAIVESHGQKRAEMLLSEAADADIVKLDADAGLARIRLARLELAEIELAERLDRARDTQQREAEAVRCDDVAAKVEQIASRLEKAIEELAIAADEMVAAIPADLIRMRDYEPTMGIIDQPSPQQFVASIVAEAIYQRSPGLFRVGNDYCGGVDIALQLYTHNPNGSLNRIIPTNDDGKKFALASGAADSHVVQPLRRVAADLRAGRANE